MCCGKSDWRKFIKQAKHREMTLWKRRGLGVVEKAVTCPSR
jgi:hypothetical protein